MDSLLTQRSDFAVPTAVALPPGWTINKSVLTPGGLTVAVYAAGTSYSLTNAAAALVFGTTSPALVLTAGTWLLLSSINLKANAATVVAETVTLKLRRTNNTAADVTAAARTIAPPAIVTKTQTVGLIELPPTNNDDTITIFGVVSATLGAGTLDTVEASIVAVRLW